MRVAGISALDGFLQHSESESSDYDSSAHNYAPNGAKSEIPKMINDFSSDLQQNQVTSHITSLSKDTKVASAQRKIKRTKMYSVFLFKDFCYCHK